MAGSDSQVSGKLMAVIVAGCILVVAVIVIVKNSGGGDSAPDLTVCESSWQEAERSASDAGPQSNTQVMAQSTLTACDTVAEWDAANVRFGSDMAEGAAAVDNLCSSVGVSDTRLCMEAKQNRASPSP